METLIKEIQDRVQRITSRLYEELQGVRSNRPSVALIEDVPVEAYGQQLKVKEVASLSIRPPREIEVSVWDKSIAPTVSKAIETAKAGFSIASDGGIIHVVLPPLTDDRREEITRMIKKMVEAARIEVRNTRDDINKKMRAMEDAGGLSEDQAFRGKEQVQKVVDGTNQKIEQLLSTKLSELAE